MNLKRDDFYNTVVYSSYMIYLTFRMISACWRGVNYLYSNIKDMAVTFYFQKISIKAIIYADSSLQNENRLMHHLIVLFKWNLSHIFALHKEEIINCSEFQVHCARKWNNVKLLINLMSKWIENTCRMWWFISIQFFISHFSCIPEIKAYQITITRSKM